MKQITKWFFPKQKTYCRGERMTLGQWCEQERKDIQRRTGKECIIKENASGQIAVYKLTKNQKKGKNNE